MVANYVAFDIKTSPKPGEGLMCVWKGTPVMCGPRGLASSPNVLYHNIGGGKFEDVSAQAGLGIACVRASLSCAFADFDNDGDIDILIVNLNEPPSLLRNDVSGGHHWLKVKLIGVKSNRSAIGARVTAHYGEKKQAQEVLSQSSFYSVSDLRLHFGLGDAVTADLEIRWPNGALEKITKVPADHLIWLK